jgi:SAM-dependent methyltransferase
MKSIKTAKKNFLLSFLKIVKRGMDHFILPDSSCMLKSRIRHAREGINLFMRSSGPVLEIGSGNRAISSEAVKLDLDFYKGVNIVADAHFLPLRNNSFGFIWLGGVIEHITVPLRVAEEIHRVLKKGGYVYIETPFFQCYHAAPFDFQRFTLYGLEKLFESNNFIKINSGIIAGPSSAFSHILRTYLALLFSFNSKILFHILYYYIAGWLVFPFKIFDLFLINHPKAEIMPFAVYYLGKKI